MKKTAIMVIITLLLCLIISPTVIAGEGLDVDILVTGDDAEVDIEVTGDNSIVTVDGKIPFEVYHQLYNDQWILTWTVEKEQEIEELCATLGVTVEGLAQVILLAQMNNQSIAEVLTFLDTQRMTIDEVIAQQASIEERIQIRTDEVDASLVATQDGITQTEEQLITAHKFLRIDLAETDSKAGSNKILISGVQASLLDTDNSIGSLRAELAWGLGNTMSVVDNMGGELNGRLHAQAIALEAAQEESATRAEYLARRVDDLVTQRILMARLLLGLAIATVCAFVILCNALRKSKLK